jgi:hypothetical protein
VLVLPYTRPWPSWRSLLSNGSQFPCALPPFTLTTPGALALWKKSAVNIANRKDIPRKSEENKELCEGFRQDPFKLTVAEAPPSSRTRYAMREPPPQSRDSSASSRSSHSTSEHSSGLGSRQAQSSSGSYRIDANPRNPDEQIINEALLRLLESISLYDTGSNENPEWSSARKTFSVQQGDAKWQPRERCLIIRQNCDRI